MVRLLGSVWLIVGTLAAGCGSGELFGSKKDDAAPSAPVAAPTTPDPAAGPRANDPSGVMATDASRLLDLPEGDSYLSNLQTLITSTNLANYYKSSQHGQNLKIAVLDNGFAGLNHSLGNRLPPDTKLVTPPVDQMQETTHGVKLAEIVYAMATGKASYAADVPGPKMLLLNTDGFTNLQAAVATIIAEKVDIVLYAQVWQYGGNFDGKGFINAEINKATAAGILWINAAGNLGKSTYNGKIVDLAADKQQVVLPYNGRYVRFTVPRDQTDITAVLSWNDFKDTKDYATPQDLDLIIEDEQHNVVGSSRLHQTGVLPDTSPTAQPPDPLYSAHARESIATKLNVGTYYARIEDHSHNFTAASSFRLSIDGDTVRLLDTSAGGSLGIPADNPSVLTVGAGDVDYSSIGLDASGKQVKPEAQVSSLVVFSDGENHYGTSSASAIVAGALAVYISNNGPINRAKALELMASGSLAKARTDATKPYDFRLK